MARRVGRTLPSRRRTDRYAKALATIPHDGEWYELVPRFADRNYGYRVARKLREGEMDVGDERVRDWEFKGGVVRGKGVVYVRWTK